MSVRVQQRPGRAAPAPAAVRDLRGWGVIAGPAALAAVLSLIGLTGRSLGFDEGATASIAAQHGAALWRAIAHDGGNMSAYYLLMHVLTALFGNGLVVLRLPSVIATVATVALIAVIAERLFADRRVSLAAGVLAAVSLPLVYWGQTARGYASMVAFVCAAMLAFIALVDRRRWPRAARPVAGLRGRDDAGHVLQLRRRAGDPGAGAGLLARRGAARRYGSALVAVAVLCLPAGGPRGAARLGPALLGAAAEPDGRHPGAPVRHLRGPPARVSPQLHDQGADVGHAGGGGGPRRLHGAAVAARRGGVGDGAGAVVVRAAGGADLPVLGARAADLRPAQRPDVHPGAGPRLRPGAQRPALAPLPRPGAAGGGAGGAGHPGRAGLRRLARAVAGGDGSRPGRGPAGRLRHLLPGGRPDGLPVLRRHRRRHPPGPARRVRRCSRGASCAPSSRTMPFHRRRRWRGGPRGCARMWLVSSHEGQANGPPQARANRARWFRLAGSFSGGSAPGRCASTGTPASSTSSSCRGPRLRGAA